MLFVACLGQQGLAPTTIKTYLSGVHQMQIATGYPDINLPLQPRLHQVLKGVEQLHGIRGASARLRHASRSLLTSSGRCLEQSGGHKAGQQRMLWAVALTAFFGFCRSREVTVPREGEYNPAVHLSYWTLPTISSGNHRWCQYCCRGRRLTKPVEE